MTHTYILPHPHTFTYPITPNHTQSDQHFYECSHSYNGANSHLCTHTHMCTWLTYTHSDLHSWAHSHTYINILLSSQSSIFTPVCKQTYTLTVMTSFMPTWHNLESFRKKEPQLRKCPPTSLVCGQASAALPWLMIDVEGPRSLWAVLSLGWWSGVP